MNMITITLRLFIQALTVGVILYCIVGLIVWALRSELRRIWAIPTLTWLVHALVFYAISLPVLSLKIPHTIDFTTWSAVLRLHGYCIVAFIIIELNILNGKLDGHHDTKRLS